MARLKTKERLKKRLEECLVKRTELKTELIAIESEIQQLEVDIETEETREIGTWLKKKGLTFDDIQRIVEHNKESK